MRTRVQALQPVLAGVSASASSTTARQRPISSLSAYYVNALALARVILRGASLMPIGAGSTGAVVLYGMNRIWEDYVATRLRDTYGGAVRSRLTFQLGGNAGWTAEADAVTVHAGKITALVDAKYKPVDQAPSRDDAYQMISYCEALGLSDASLVYPGEDQHRIVQVGGKTLHIRGLQPGRDIDWGLAGRA